MALTGASFFAGRYAAYNFAYGVNPDVPALQLWTPPVSAGARSVPVAVGYTTTSDGIEFYPLSTDAAVRVGSDSNAESVTPSAVSNVNSGYAQMNFTATFSNAHAAGDPVASATVGLQEAINLAIANGGGTVVVDAAWAAAGGTSGMISGATFDSPVTVTIEDNRTGV